MKFIFMVLATLSSSHASKSDVFQKAFNYCAHLSQEELSHYVFESNQVKGEVEDCAYAVEVEWSKS